MGAVATAGTDVTGAQGDVDEAEKSVGAVFDDAMGGREDVLVADERPTAGEIFPAGILNEEVSHPRELVEQQIRPSALNRSCCTYKY